MQNSSLDRHHSDWQEWPCWCMIKSCRDSNPGGPSERTLPYCSHLPPLHISQWSCRFNISYFLLILEFQMTWTYERYKKAASRDSLISFQLLLAGAEAKWELAFGFWALLQSFQQLVMSSNFYSLLTLFWDWLKINVLLGLIGHLVTSGALVLHAWLYPGYLVHAKSIP